MIQGNPLFQWRGSLWGTFLLYHRSGHFPQPCHPNSTRSHLRCVSWVGKMHAGNGSGWSRFSFVRHKGVSTLMLGSFGCSQRTQQKQHQLEIFGLLGRRHPPAVPLLRQRALPHHALPRRRQGANKRSRPLARGKAVVSGWGQGSDPI